MVFTASHMRIRRAMKIANPSCDVVIDFGSNLVPPWRFSRRVNLAEFTRRAVTLVDHEQVDEFSPLQLEASFNPPRASFDEVINFRFMKMLLNLARPTLLDAALYVSDTRRSTLRFCNLFLFWAKYEKIPI